MFAYITLPLLCLSVCAGYTIIVPYSPKLEIQTSDMNPVDQFMSKVNLEQLKELMTLQKSTLFDQIAAMDEFKQILELLESKGYSMQFLSDVLNTFLNSSLKKTQHTEQQFDRSVDDVKAELAEDIYLIDNPEVERLLETLSTDEFIDMLNKLLEKFKEIIEDYAKEIRNRACDFLKKILGDKFSSPFCS